MLHHTQHVSTIDSLALVTGFGCCGPAFAGGDLRPVGGEVPCDAETTKDEQNTYSIAAIIAETKGTCAPVEFMHN